MLVKKVKTFLSEQNIDTDKHFLIALSGGLDSMVLCHVFQELKLSFAIAHCNFNLRNIESNNDENFVQAYCKENQIETHFISFDTKAYAKEHKLSIQLSARELRYNWFQQITKDYLVTAHHLDDHAETMIFNIVRGSHYKGITGISLQNKELIRPLSYVSRNEIIEYAKKNNIEWREDSSNSSVKYNRNKIRHQVSPILNEINPKFANNLRNLADRMDLLNLYLDDKKEEIKNNVSINENENIYLEKEYFKNSPHPLFELSIILDDFGFSLDQCKSILKKQLSGTLFHSSTHKLLLDRKSYIISTIAQEKKIEFKIVLTADTKNCVTPNFTLCTKFMELETIQFDKSGNTAYFDLDKIKFPLTIENWKQGDYMTPFGMNGKKQKISDILINRKTPVPFKKEILVLKDATDEILWLIGMRQDDINRISLSTKTCYVLTIEKQDYI